MTNEVYITKAAKFLPNQPVSNDEMEDYLGMIHHLSSKSRRIVLRNNGIKSRYYAIDKNGVATHTNSQMVSLAIRNLMDNDPEKIKAMRGRRRRGKPAAPRSAASNRTGRDSGCG